MYREADIAYRITRLQRNSSMKVTGLAGLHIEGTHSRKEQGIHRTSLADKGQNADSSQEGGLNGLMKTHISKLGFSGYATIIHCLILDRDHQSWAPHLAKR